MRRKSFVRELGALGGASIALTLAILTIQTIMEIQGDPRADALTWSFIGGMTGLIACMTVVVYRHVRRHNAKVDAELRRQRENWARVNKSQSPQHWGH